MYALVKTGGKQYRVSKDDTILVERIAAEEGAEVILNDIVMLGDGDKVTIGTPKVDGAAVSATVVRQTRGPKIIIFRRKRRKNHRRHLGRQMAHVLHAGNSPNPARHCQSAYRFWLDLEISFWCFQFTLSG